MQKNCFWLSYRHLCPCLRLLFLKIWLESKYENHKDLHSDFPSIVFENLSFLYLCKINVLAVLIYLICQSFLETSIWDFFLTIIFVVFHIRKFQFFFRFFFFYSISFFQAYSFFSISLIFRFIVVLVVFLVVLYFFLNYLLVVFFFSKIFWHSVFVAFSNLRYCSISYFFSIFSLKELRSFSNSSRISSRYSSFVFCFCYFVFSFILKFQWWS